MLHVFGALAQNRYMVFFNSKENSSFSVDRPLEIVSEKSLARREKHDVVMSEEDLPVNQSFVDQLATMDIQTYFTTKWLNGVLVQATSEQVQEVQGLSFVDHVELVAPGIRLTPGRKKAPQADSFTQPDTRDFNTTLQLNVLGVDEMHAEGNFGQDVLIAVMDGGFGGVHESSVFQHLYDDEQLLATRDFVTNSFDVYRFSTHGTSVLSCLAGYVNEEVKGVAYGADYALFLTEEIGSEYRVEEYNWLFAAEMADSMGVDIINTSLGYTDFDDPNMNYSYGDLDGQSTVVSRAAQMAFERGMLVVTSAGNLGNSSWNFVSAPADGENVLAVGAVNADFDKAGFSSVGPTPDDRIKPDVVALGDNVTVFSNNVFRQGDGTSFAAPLVAGLAAGLLHANPERKNNNLLAALRNSGTLADEPNNEIGYGIPNFRAGESGAALSVENPSQLVKAYPNPVSGTSSLTLEVKNSPFRKVKLTDTNGRVLTTFKLKNKDVYNIDFQSFRSGLYFLILEGRNVREMLRIQKIE